MKKSEEEAIKRARAAIMRARREGGHNATAELQAILGHSGKDPVLGEWVKKNDAAMAGIEDTDEEDDLESDLEGNG